MEFFIDRKTPRWINPFFFKFNRIVNLKNSLNYSLNGTNVLKMILNRKIHAMNRQKCQVVSRWWGKKCIVHGDKFRKSVQGNGTIGQDWVKSQCYVNSVSSSSLSLKAAKFSIFFSLAQTGWLGGLWRLAISAECRPCSPRQGLWWTREKSTRTARDKWIGGLLSAPQEYCLWALRSKHKIMNKVATDILVPPFHSFRARAYSFIVYVSHNIYFLQLYRPFLHLKDPWKQRMRYTIGFPLNLFSETPVIGESDIIKVTGSQFTTRSPIHLWDTSDALWCTYTYRKCTQAGAMRAI